MLGAEAEVEGTDELILRSTIAGFGSCFGLLLLTYLLTSIGISEGQGYFSSMVVVVECAGLPSLHTYIHGWSCHGKRKRILKH
ncbi:hypothetical protein ASPBRDRAFT_469244 [Aspergillus brasiliensis CBS 101740]|uniref:Uncharacterized protein n=1 Tax=Aspergillus brasiliensis (strain CBS 101740 / IMI 381727 / IBT 21946) TaxID=767769 RepID=A0A1L9UTH2_ASPBC|nr:hypothetical protein ASPBRDRAFT_469244 [Aspergillus brasiliensis CBS 101740]